MTKITKTIYLVLFLVFLTNSAFAESSIADEEEKEPIVVRGDRVEYLYEEKRVIGFNNIIINYKEMVLTCDRIEVDMEKRIAKASGNAILRQGESVYKGERIDYDFDAEIGTVIEAEIGSEPWYGKAPVVNKVSEKDYVVQKGHLSTCRLDPPHYRIAAKELKIVMDDRIEAKNVVAYVGRWPVFYFPYYYHPLHDRRPRVTIIPGRDDRWGYYALTAWRYYFHEWARGYFHFDIRERKGLGYGVDYKYRAGYFGKGLARFYYTDEFDFRELVKDEEEGEREPTQREMFTGFDPEDDRWRMQLRHKWEIDTDTLAIAEYHKVKDSLFTKDYFFEEEYEKEGDPETYLSIIRAKRNFTLSAFARRRINKFYTVVEKLPELKLDVLGQKMYPEKPFVYNSTTMFSNFSTRSANDQGENLKANRIDTYQKYSYPFKVFGALSLNPYTAGRLTWFSEDKLGHMNEYRFVPTLGIESSIRFHKIFPLDTDFLELDIRNLRHLIRPSIHYSYTPTPNIKSVDLKAFDGIDGIGRNHRISLELENKLQTKRGVDKKPFDLVRFITRTDFILDMKDPQPDDPDQESDKNITRLDDINLDLEIRPYPWLFLKSVARWDYTLKRFESFDTDLTAFDDDEKWSFGLSHRFDNVPALGVVSQFTSDIAYQISPKWNFAMYHRLKRDYAKNDYKLDEQEYVLTRDLHCWLAELVYTVKRNTQEHAELKNVVRTKFDHSIWLVMRIKAFPEISIRPARARYSKPRGGAANR